MKRKILILFLFVLLVGFISATNYYVDNDLTDINVASATPDCTTYNQVTGVCGGGTASAFKSLRDINALINSFSGATQNNIYFQRGDSWVFTSNSDSIIILKSNVTLDAFGLGDKPALDGNNQFPTGVTENDIPYGFAIKVGNSASTIPLLSNVHIKNLRVQNMYPGGGIMFSGLDAPSGYFTGPGSVKNCEIYNIGWAGISLFRIPNDLGNAGAIKIENNHLKDLVNYHKGPQSIAACDGTTHGHQCRYNIVENSYGEGICGEGFEVVEYNIISDTDNPSIYFGGSTKINSTIRYNLILGDSNGEYGKGEIRIDDEGEGGDNSNVRIKVYGNIVVGGEVCINLRNNPLDGSGWFPMGGIDIYNNLCIDNKKSIIAAYSNRFNDVEIKNNAFIINPDSESACQHIDHWVKSGESEDWSGWEWGPNFWYGDVGDTTKGMWSMPFYNSTRDATSSTPPLPKYSGWRSLTSLSDFSFADLTPQEASALVDNLKAEIISGYNQYLTTGTNFSKLPENPTFVLADQDSEGSAWDFGAVVYDFGGETICVHEADQEPCDGRVDRGELDDYIVEWKSNSGISLIQVIEAIGKWKN